MKFHGLQSVERLNSWILECCCGLAQGVISMMENEAMMVVVMEFCDLWSLQRAISKKAFKPHGKFTDQATYVGLPHDCLQMQT